MPVAQIARLGSGQQTVNGALTAPQVLLGRADQDERLPRRQLHPQMEGAAEGLTNNRQFLAIRQAQASAADGAPVVEAEAELRPQLARDGAADHGPGAGPEADVGDEVELAGRHLGGRDGGAHPVATGDAEHGGAESAGPEAGEQRPSRQAARHGAGQLVKGVVVQGGLLCTHGERPSQPTEARESAIPGNRDEAHHV